MPRWIANIGADHGPWNRNLDVLLVDDNPIIRKLVNLTLSRWGYILDWTSSVEEAMERIGEHSFDLVIIDIGAPWVEGMYSLRRICEIADRPPIIALSGFQIPDRMQVRTVGAQGFVAKPLIPVLLAAEIDRVMGA